MSSENASRPALTVFGEEESMFREAVRDFAENEVRPRVAAMDEAGKYDESLIPKLFEMGLMSIEIPDALGGAGGTFFQSILAVEELSRVDAAVGVLVDVQNTLFINALLRWGTEAQKKEFLGGAVEGSVCAYALSEAGSGSDAFALKTRATPKDGGFVLDGQKLWITNAGEASQFLVFATIDPSKGYKGITAFLVKRDDAGFSVGKREHKLGIRASSTCELLLDQCFVPAGRVIGEVGKGYKIAIETLNEGRIGIGAQMVGVAQGALDAARRYALEREQFGKKIAEFQGIQFLLADCATRLEAARLLVYNAARLKEGGQPFVREAAIAKLFASEAAEKVAASALEVFGGYGYTVDYPAEKYYRDAKIGKIYEGTSFMQLQTIAKLLLSE